MLSFKKRAWVLEEVLSSSSSAANFLGRVAIEILTGKLKGFKLRCEFAIAAFFWHSFCTHPVS